MAKILIIDDDQHILNIVSLLMQRNQYDVLVAEDGEKGVAMALEHQPDLILLDLMMPMVSGYDVLKHLRNDTRTYHTPVIVLTARNQAIDRSMAMQVGANAFLSKPIVLDDLKAAVAATLQQEEGQQTQSLLNAQALDLSDVTPAALKPKSAPTQTATLPAAAVVKPNIASIPNLITVLGWKGGKGATTLSMNIAMALRRQQKVVCLIDMNPKFGELSQHLGLMDNKSWADLVGVDPNLDNIRDVLTFHKQSQIGILAAPLTLDATPPDERQTLAVVNALKGSSDYMIADASVLDARTLAVMAASQAVILLLDNNETSILQINKLLAPLMSKGVEPVRIHPVLNQINDISPMTIHQASELMGMPIEAEIPFEAGHVVAKAQNVPMEILQPGGAYSQAVHRLVRLLVTGV